MFFCNPQRCNPFLKKLQGASYMASTYNKVLLTYRTLIIPITTTVLIFPSTSPESRFLLDTFKYLLNFWIFFQTLLIHLYPFILLFGNVPFVNHFSRYLFKFSFSLYFTVIFSVLILTGTLYHKQFH